MLVEVSFDSRSLCSFGFEPLSLGRDGHSAGPWRSRCLSEPSFDGSFGSVHLLDVVPEPPPVGQLRAAEVAAEGAAVRLEPPLMNSIDVFVQVGLLGEVAVANGAIELARLFVN